MRAFRIWFLFLVTSGWLLGQFGPAPDIAAPASALTIFNAYLAQAALSETSYRADLQPCNDVTHVPLGRLLGQGPMIGSFTYRPKIYNELSRSEREAMLRESRFHAFLIAAREQADTGNDDIQTGESPASMGGGKKSEADNSVSRLVLPCFSISPTEMLQRRPMFVVLPRP
jgi:hypothetical protein